MSDSEGRPRIDAKSASRALDILEALGKDGGGLTFTDLRHRLDLPKSTLHGLLRLLADRSYIAIDPDTRRYALGIRVWEVGKAYVRHLELVDLALPEMELVVEELNETVQLSVLDRSDNVYLAKVDCTHPVRLQTDEGKRFPAHATALGKVLLSELSPAEVRERLEDSELEAIAPNTITRMDELMDELSRTSARGFGSDWEEAMPGLRCVAVPIWDNETAVAALSAAVPTFRASQDQMARAIKLLVKASLAISRRLGAMSDAASLVRLAGMSHRDLRSAYVATAPEAMPGEPQGAELLD